MSDRGRHDDDERWLERVREVYRPEPLTPARRAALDRSLEERIRRPRWSGAWRPAFGALAAGLAALALLLALPTSQTPERVYAEAAWEWEVFYPEELGEAGVDDALPGEYGVLASLFLDE